MTLFAKGMERIGLCSLQEHKYQINRGKGTMTWFDNNVYKGEWKHDRENGRGTRKFPDGTKYVGDWTNGERNGLGVEYDSSGEINYEGEWINGKKQNIFNRLITWLGL